MDKRELEKYITETYSADSDFPWARYPDYEVFRHENNRKWFALVMNIPKSKLGLRDEGTIDVVNFKCDPVLAGSFRTEAGIYPAYHMSRENWVTVALDGSVPEDKIKTLLDMSFELTSVKKIKKAGRR